MSTMLLSLLIQARDQASAGLARVRQNLMQARSSAQGTQLALAGTGQGTLVAATQAQELGRSLGEAAVKARAIAQAFAVGGVIGVASFGAALKKAFDIGLENEHLEERLRGVEQTEGRAKAALATVRAFRSHTALALADVADSWAELRKRGMEPTGITLTALADAATATGKTMAHTAAAVAAFAQSGGAMASALEDYGIKAKVQGHNLILTYEHLGKTMREVVPKDNKILVQNAVVRAFGRRFEGAAERSSRSWTGLMMRMKEGFEEFALDVMDKGGVLKTIETEIDRFLKAGGDGGNRNFAEAVAEGLKYVITKLGEFARWCKTELPGIRARVHDFISVIGGIKVVVAGALAILAAPFLVALLGVAKAIGGPVLIALKVMVPWLMKLATIIGGPVIAAIRLLSVALVTTPVGWIILGIMALIAIAWLLYENWDQVVAYLDGLWQQMVADATSDWEDLKALATTAADKLMAAWENVRAFFNALWADIKAGFDAAFGWIVQGITKLKAAIPSLPSFSSAGQAASAIGEWAKTKVEGAIEVAVKVVGPAEAEITRSTARGPVAIDASLGQTMVFP